MTDLAIAITDHRVRRRLFGESADWIWEGDEVKFALGAILDGIEARKPDAVLCQALYEHPELCELAASIHELRKISDLDDIEALPLLTAIRQHGNPEWLQAMAGNELARRGVRAVCDAPSVDDRPGQDAGEALVGVQCYFSNNGNDWTPFSEVCRGYDLYNGYDSVRHGNFGRGYWKHAKPIGLAT